MACWFYLRRAPARFEQKAANFCRKRPMATTLSRDDYALLEQLNGGPRTISGNRPREGADRVVEAGYAKAGNLNISSVEYTITNLGRQALMLKQFGVPSTQFSVEPHRHDVDGLWYLKITSEGNPAILMSVGKATQLAIALRSVGADDKANDFDHQIEKARRYAFGK